MFMSVNYQISYCGHVSGIQDSGPQALRIRDPAVKCNFLSSLRSASGLRLARPGTTGHFAWHLTTWFAMPRLASPVLLWWSPSAGVIAATVARLMLAPCNWTSLDILPLSLVLARVKSCRRHNKMNSCSHRTWPCCILCFSLERVKRILWGCHSRQMPASPLLHLRPLQLPLPLPESNGGRLWTCSENAVGACKASALTSFEGLGSASVGFCLLGWEKGQKLFSGRRSLSSRAKSVIRSKRDLCGAAPWQHIFWSLCDFSLLPSLRSCSIKSCKKVPLVFPRKEMSFAFSNVHVVNPFGFHRAAEASGQRAPWFMHRSVEKTKIVTRLDTKHFRWVVQIVHFYFDGVVAWWESMQSNARSIDVQTMCLPLKAPAGRCRHKEIYHGSCRLQAHDQTINAVHQFSKNLVSFWLSLICSHQTLMATFFVT